MLHRTLITLISAAALMSSALSQTTIGTKGAKIDLNNEWKRAELTTDLGPDQFAGTGENRGQFFFLLENEGLFIEENDLHLLAETMISGMELMGDDLNREKVRHSMLGGARFAQVGADAEMQGMELRYEIAVVARDGLAYVIVSWGVQSKSGNLDKIVRDLAGAIEYPGPKTKWGKSTQLERKKVRLGHDVISFVYQESVLTPAHDPGDALFMVTTPMEDFAFAVLEMTKTDSLDEECRAICSVMVTDLETLNQESREVLVIDGKSCLRTQVSFMEQGKMGADLIQIDLGDGRLADVRLTYSGEASRWQEYRDQFVSSIRIESQLVDNPFPVRGADPQVFTLNPNQRDIIDGSAVLGRVPDYPNHVASTKEGFLVAAYEGIWRIPADGSEKHALLEAPEYSSYRCIADTGRKQYTISDEGILQSLRNGGTRATSTEATWLDSSADGTLFLLRPIIKEPVPGFMNTPNLGHELITRSLGGREEVVLRTQHGNTPRFAISAKGDHALVIDRTWSHGYASHDKLIDHDLQSGTSVDLGVWTGLREACRKPGGWIVTGRPSGASAGIYDVVVGREPKLLIGGDEVHGFGLDDDGHLVWAGSLATQSDPEAEFPWIVRSTPMELALKSGDGCQGWTVRSLNETAASAFASTGFDSNSMSEMHDWATLGTLLQIADGIAKSTLGMGLPSDASAIDTLANALVGEERVSDHGMWLLAAMVSRNLMDSGAEWVKSSGRPLSVSTLGSYGDGNDFAMTANPLRLLIETSLPDAEMASPIWATLEASEGRRILLGMDEATLAAKLVELDRPDWDALLETQSLATTQRFLEAHRENGRMRGKAYAALERADRLADVLTLAAGWAGTEDSENRDDLVWLGARVTLQVFADTPALIQDIRAAIERHPNDAQLYAILGIAYEATGDENDLNRARACYLKASEMSWGAVADFAQKSLNRLDE